jgi:hypothetical protein
MKFFALPVAIFSSSRLINSSITPAIIPHILFQIHSLKCHGWCTSTRDSKWHEINQVGEQIMEQQSSAVQVKAQECFISFFAIKFAPHPFMECNFFLYPPYFNNSFSLRNSNICKAFVARN